VSILKVKHRNFCNVLNLFFHKSKENFESALLVIENYFRVEIP
jgi:hypothetical protein